jgi:hypothetical protein
MGLRYLTLVSEVALSDDDAPAPALFSVDAAVLNDPDVIAAIRERAAKLNLSPELVKALELRFTGRNSDGASGDVTSFLASLLGSFLPVFDAATASDGDKGSIL